MVWQHRVMHGERGGGRVGETVQTHEMDGSLRLIQQVTN